MRHPGAVVAGGDFTQLVGAHAGQRLFSFALTLILGGAIGNVVDRLMHGYVVDFLDFHWGGWHYPAFNVADIAIVWAQTDDGIQGFVVEKGTPGFTAQEIKHKMSLRASVTSALFFDNVRVPDSSRLPNVKGLKGPLGCLTQARYGITWGPIGAAIACLDEVLAYTKERILFDRPVAATQSAQIKMAEMARRITLAQLLVLQLGRLKDAGTLQPTQVSLAKWNNCRMAIDIARECRDLLGGAGITTEHAAIRHALNLESVITYEGTETVHQLVIGRELTGINAF